MSYQCQENSKGSPEESLVSFKDWKNISRFVSIEAFCFKKGLAASWSPSSLTSAAYNQNKSNCIKSVLNEQFTVCPLNEVFKSHPTKVFLYHWNLAKRKKKGKEELKFYPCLEIDSARSFETNLCSYASKKSLVGDVILQLPVSDGFAPLWNLQRDHPGQPRLVRCSHVLAGQWPYEPLKLQFNLNPSLSTRFWEPAVAGDPRRLPILILSMHNVT